MKVSIEQIINFKTELLYYGGYDDNPDGAVISRRQ